MVFARVFCGFFASLMIAITAQNAFATGYSCTKTYSKCNSGYYLLNGTTCTSCGGGDWTSPSGNTSGITSCNRKCTLNDLSNTTNVASVSGSVYRTASGSAVDISKCQVTCNTGYNLVSNSTSCLSITITLDPNGGTGGTTVIYSRKSTSCTHLTTSLYIDSGLTTGISGNITKPTRDGYTFKGYYNNTYTLQKLTASLATVSCSGSSDSSKWLVTEPTTWHASWTPISYTITYDLNGGTGCANQNYTIETNTLKLCEKATRDGYTFGGWYTGQNGSGTETEEIAKGSTGDKTFYAKWVANKTTVTFHKYNAASQQTFTFDTTVAKLTSLPTRTGYTFAGYYTEQDGKGTKYFDENGNYVKSGANGKWNYVNTDNASTGALNLYAYWTANTYAITFNNKCPALTHTNWTANFVLNEIYGDKWYVSTDSEKTKITEYTAPTCVGYTFQGYYTASTGGSKVISAPSGDKFTLPSNTRYSQNTTLYAHWSPIKYTARLNINKPAKMSGEIAFANCGLNNMSCPYFDTECTYDTDCNLTTTIGGTGWTFNGWFTAQVGGTQLGTVANEFVANNLTSTNGAVVNVYAQWEQNTYEIVYNGNRPSTAHGYIVMSIPNTECTYDEICTLTNKHPTLVGWTFDGWYIDPVDGDAITEIKNAATGGTVTVYAHWTANQYKITFDPTGGIIDGDDEMTVTYDAPVGSVITPRKPGSTFAGYYSDGVKYFDENGDYAIKNVNGEWRNTSDITLFATWSICPSGSYCPGNTSHEMYSCAETLSRTPHPSFDKLGTKTDDSYWDQSDEGAVLASDCYRICRSTGDPIADDPSTNNGHGTLICATGTEVMVDGAKQCRAYYDPNRGSTDSGSCKYTTTKDTCHTGYSPSFSGHEIAACEPNGYRVTYHANDNSGIAEWTYTQNCEVFSDCILEDLTDGAHKLPERPGYIFTGWSLSRAYTATPWNSVNLKTQLPGDNNDGPTGDVPLYAIWGKCDYGYYWDGRGACVACPLDSYKDTISNATGAGQISMCTKCAVGFYTDDTAKTKDTDCKECPDGAFCENGYGKQECPVYTHADKNFANIAELLGLQYTSDAKVATADKCYLDCPEFDVEYGHATPIAPTRVNYNNQCKYECISETGNAGHVENSRCIEDKCNPEFEFALVNGIKVCTACNRENAITYRAGRNCVIESCVLGYHPTAMGDKCEADEMPCTIVNATEAYKTWNPTSGKFDICTPRECKQGFHIDGNLCVVDSTECQIENGKGVMEWDDVHNRWGECIATECNPGYTNDPYESNNPAQKCGECRNRYGVSGDIAVATYKRGCEIEYCRYQGELYNLEGNECVPICDINGYSDETGEMKWNPSTGKCERTCNDGYIPWD